MMELTGQSPQTIPSWAYEISGHKMTNTSSFSLEDVMVIDIARRHYSGAGFGPVALLWYHCLYEFPLSTP